MSDRKYRQSGYQDQDSPRPRRQQGPRPERQPGPRGRGLGRPTASAFRCAVCGEKQPEAEVAFDSACFACKTALHSCTHCVSFDTSATFECRQPIEARVPSKAKANRCSLFTPKAAQEFAKDSDLPGPSDARTAFDALFKL